MTAMQHKLAPKAERKTYAPPPAVAAKPGQTWRIMRRPPGSHDDGEQATPSTFAGTEAEVKAYVAEQTVASQRPGNGPAFDYLFVAE